MIEYLDNYKVALFNGYKFTRRESNGYFLNSKNVNGKRQNLHVYVWEFYNGAVPAGMQVHHKTLDKNKNEINDLELIESHKHMALHSKLKSKDDITMKKWHTAGIESAKEWHASEEGREWHRTHYQKIKNNLHAKVKSTCEYCNVEYMSPGRNIDRFCSNKCKSSWRVKSGVDNENRNCIMCGNEFSVNKYTKTQTCSGKCSAAKRIASGGIRGNKKS